jgi:hypothetical protein
MLFNCVPKDRYTEINFAKLSAESSSIDDLANFISGMPLAIQSNYSKSAEENFYKSYKKEMDSLWSKINANYIQNVKKWSSENLPEQTKNNAGFYPLSGADFLNLYHFSPNSKKFLMIGLETPGFISSPKEENKKELINSFNLLKLTFNQHAKQNYFSTNLMEYKFKNKLFPGVSPVLIIFLKRVGFKIDGIQRVRIQETGKLQEISEEQVNDVPEALQGVRIFFHADKEEIAERELVFIKMFINENSADTNLPTGRFFDNYPRFNLVMKSAIYLMHMEKFKPFIDKILSKTDMIVEDDSGIPVKYFNDTEWNIHPFGIYRSRIPIKYVTREANMFKTDKGNLYTEQRKFTQTELIEIFNQKAKPLDFRYGYGGSISKANSNLILAVRKSILSKQ